MTPEQQALADDMKSFIRDCGLGAVIAMAGGCIALYIIGAALVGHGL